jgi:hypothetical protein
MKRENVFFLLRMRGVRRVVKNNANSITTTVLGLILYFSQNTSSHSKLCALLSK